MKTEHKMEFIEHDETGNDMSTSKKQRLVNKNLGKNITKDHNKIYDEIEKRLSRFGEEDDLKKEFDYTLINDNFETTFEKIKKMIISLLSL